MKGHLSGKVHAPKLRGPGIKTCLRCGFEFEGSIENRICKPCKIGGADRRVKKPNKHFHVSGPGKP